ncbi:hypothetical protein ACPA2M_02600, partial [Ectopseudomonas chengduensis]
PAERLADVQPIGGVPTEPLPYDFCCLSAEGKALLRLDAPSAKSLNRAALRDQSLLGQRLVDSFKP